VSRAVALALTTRLGRGGSRRWGLLGEAATAEYELDSGVFDGVWERRTLLEDGGWDERWLRNQDSEMAGRFLARGERLICLTAMGAIYAPRGGLRSLWRQYREYGMYRELTAVRHPDTMRRSHLLPPGLVVAFASSVVGAGPLRRLARGALGIYAGALAGSVVLVWPTAEHKADVALVPVVLAVIHVAHGVGAIQGAIRYGPPTSALARVLALRGVARRTAPSPQAVWAPSLWSEELRPHASADDVPRASSTTTAPTNTTTSTRG